MKKATAAKLPEQVRSLGVGSARVFRAPGRVNLIGEHTDYNDGFVMPAAINFYACVAIAPRKERKLEIHSDNFSESVELDLNGRPPQRRNHWSDYVIGVAVMLERAGHQLAGANLQIWGDVPIGAGLSSSAALEVAAGLAFVEAFHLGVGRAELARLCQRAENEFVGARVGIMDQFISCFGHKGKAMFLDCRSLQYRGVPLPDDVSLVICNTMVKHKLAAGEYNTRRAECEEGVRILSRRLPQIRALRDVNLADLERYKSELPDTIFKRCRHVISENARVVDASAALERGDLSAFGRLMAESHRSLRDDYEVSCAELNLMVDLAEKVDGVFGARMTGGGFGGCTINLVQSEAVADFQRRVGPAYEKATGLSPQIFVSSAAAGAAELEE